MSEIQNSIRAIEKHREFPGATLVGWKPVALPVYQLHVRVMVIMKKPLEPINEFLLRSLAQGVNRTEDISNFLGLDRRTVHNHLADLHRWDLIKVEHGVNQECFLELTTQGHSVAKELRSNEITEESILVLYHGILRKPIDLKYDLLKEEECYEQDLVVLPPIPARRPPLDELKLSQLEPLAKKYWQKNRSKDKIPELIGIKSLEKERGGMYYEPATMLVHQNDSDPTQFQYSFVVDGDINEEMDERFERKIAKNKLPTNLEPIPITLEASAKKFVPKSLDYELDELLVTSEIADEIEEIAEQLKVIQSDESKKPRDDDTRQRQANEIEELNKRNQRLEAQLNGKKIVPLKTSGIIRILDEAIRTARERLVIISGTLSQYAVDKIAPELEEMIERHGVELWLGYGMGGPNQQSKSQREKSSFSPAVQRLEKIRKLYPEKVKLADLGNNHMKILLCDKKFVVVGSLNYLSHRPSGMKTMAENAVQIFDQSSIEDHSQDCESIFSRVPNG